jgi:chromosome segregation ATPase
MSSDIVKRLRDEAAAQLDLAHDCDCPPECTSNWDAAKTLNEAAARIEALEGEAVKAREYAADLRLRSKEAEDARAYCADKLSKAEARAERLSQDCDATQGVLDKTSQLLTKHMTRAERLLDTLMRLLAVANDHMTSCDRTMGDSHPCTCGADEARKELEKRNDHQT